MTTCLTYRNKDYLYLVADTEEVHLNMYKGLTKANKIIQIGGWYILGSGNTSYISVVANIFKKIPTKKYSDTDFYSVVDKAFNDEVFPDTGSEGGDAQFIVVATDKNKKVQLTAQIELSIVGDSISPNASSMSTNTPYLAVGTGSPLAYGALAAFTHLNNALAKAGKPEVEADTIIQLTMAAAAKHDIYTSSEYNVIKLVVAPE